MARDRPARESGCAARRGAALSRAGAKRTRRSPPQRAPAWQRWLGAALFLAGGGAFAAWGVHDLAAWIGALRGGRPLVETESALLGIAPLGIGVAALGPAFLVTPPPGSRAERALEAAVLAAFGLMIAGVALATLGGIAVSGAMRHHGYHACSTWQGTRMSVTRWAARGRGCPAAEPR